MPVNERVFAGKVGIETAEVLFQTGLTSGRVSMFSVANLERQFPGKEIGAAGTSSASKPRRKGKAGQANDERRKKPKQDFGKDRSHTNCSSRNWESLEANRYPTPRTVRIRVRPRSNFFRRWLT